MEQSVDGIKADWNFWPLEMEAGSWCYYFAPVLTCLSLLPVLLHSPNDDCIFPSNFLCTIFAFPTLVDCKWLDLSLKPGKDLFLQSPQDKSPGALVDFGIVDIDIITLRGC